jgi:hypothetical protein
MLKVSYKRQGVRHDQPEAFVMPLRSAGASGRLEAVRAQRWLPRFVDSPAPAAEAGGISAMDLRSARNIANWSNYLPADCVDAMVSLGWDRTT